MELPVVSIVIPAYNAARFIAETLRAVQSITYSNWECIVVNDGSTDNTLEVVEPFAASDPRIIILNQPNSGPSVARNAAIARSFGKYILPLDADDLISSDYVTQAVDVLEGRPEVKIVYCDAKLFGHRNGLWHLPEYSPKALLLENMIFCTALYRKSDYLNTRGYDPNLTEGREDWDFWLEMLKTGGQVHRLPEVHFYYRTHRVSRDRQANKNIQAIRKKIFDNHRELYANIFENPIQVYHELEFYKSKYNLLRRLTFRKPIP